jgi:hypothetical protein
MPSRSSWVKTKLKLPTQTEKPSRTPRAIRKVKFDSDIELEDNNDPHDGDGKQPLTVMIRQAALAGVVGSSHISLGGFMFLVLSLIIPSINETCKKKQQNEAKITLWPKRRHTNKRHF